MTGPAAAALVVWLVASLLALWIWLPAGYGPAASQRETRRVRIAVIAALTLAAGACGVLAGIATPLTDGWRWLAGALAAAATVLGGGAVTTCILGLASSAAPTTARVQRDVLRGGAWIGSLERLALLATLVAGWPEGMAVIVAVKGLARYPELRSASSAGTGANERFIIGTFASLGWAATCAWALSGLL